MSEEAGASVLSRTGWMWLAEHTDGLAWELLGPNQPQDDRLDIDFSEVYRSRIAPSVQAQAPALDTEVDAIVLHHLPLDDDGSEPHELMRTCRDHLRPGGYIVLSVANRAWGRTLLRRVTVRIRRGASDEEVQDHVSSDLRAVEDWLERAGFSSTRCYLSGGSTARPSTLVPAVRNAIIAHQRATVPGRLPSWLRGGLATLGLGEVFYPRIVAFGYR